jgi:hypothetical protein
MDGSALPFVGSRKPSKAAFASTTEIDSTSEMLFLDFPGYFRLMLLAARAPITSVDKEQIHKAIDEPVDWDEFLRVVVIHRIGPLVLDGLNAAAPERIPEFVKVSLGSISKANHSQVVRSVLETQRIARTFLEQGFQVTVLKGALLSEIIFRDPYRRYSVDLDLLTSKKDLPRQIHCMEELGYELIMPSCRLTPRRIRCYSRYRKDFSFKHKRSGMMVDLHWRLFNNREHKGNQFGKIQVPIDGKLFGNGLYTLPLIDQFIYCAAHGISDAWLYLKSLADFAAFLRRLTPEELDAAVDRSTELGLLPQLSSAIHLAQEWMGVPAVNARLLPPSDSLNVAMYRQVVGELERSHLAPDRADIGFETEFQLERRIVPGMKGVFEIFGRYLFRPRVWSLIDLPDSLFWMYPILGLLIPPRLSRSPR